MILITGSTGNLGSSVVAQLLKTANKSEFALLARSSEKAKGYLEQGLDVRIGDFDDSASLKPAFKGISKLLLISTMAENRFEQHKNVIDAAKEAGVKHIFYTGLGIKDIQTSNVNALMGSHFETEDYLKASGLTYTMLRNTMYADALMEIVGDLSQIPEIALSGGNGRVPYALRREMGEGIANALQQTGHENKTYVISGDELYSYADVAATVSKIRNEDIGYTDLSEDAYREKLQALNYPEFAIYLTMGSVLDIKIKQYEIEERTLSSFLGRPTKNLEEMIKELTQA